MQKILFEETLQFRQPQLWIPFLALFAAIIGLHFYVMLKNPNRDFAFRVLVPAIILFVFGGVTILLYLSRLDAKVTPSGLSTRFYPMEWSFRETEWKDIVQMRIVTIRPLRDFWGWGLRYGLNSKAYIITGDKCVELELSNGSKLYVNTLLPEKFLFALASGMESASQILQ